MNWITWLFWSSAVQSGNGCFLLPESHRSTWHVQSIPPSPPWETLPSNVSVALSPIHVTSFLVEASGNWGAVKVTSISTMSELAIPPCESCFLRSYPSLNVVTTASRGGGTQPTNANS